MADISRDIYSKEKLQDKVIFQQTKLPLTCEFNLFQDVYLNRGIDLTLLSVNSNYVGDSFKVISSATDNEIIVKSGIFYHLGRPLQIVNDVIISGLTTPSGNRTDTVFVEWFVEEIKYSDDATIVDPDLLLYMGTLAKAETARQYRINMIPRVAENSDVPNPTSGTNYFVISKLNRAASNPQITSSMISDERDKVVYTFVYTGCGVEDAGGLKISISEGDVFVAATEYVIEDTTPLLTLTASSLNYVFVDVSGVVNSATTAPLDYHLMLAEVTTNLTDIISIIDKRIFQPISWRYKYSENEGETGYPTFTLKYKAGENISKGDLVYIDSNKTVKKADASGKLPVIGISPKSIAIGQVGNIVVLGEIFLDSWSWTPGQVLYVDTISGSLTQTIPFVPGCYVQKIGIAVTDKLIYLNPDRIYIKIQNTVNSFLRLKNGVLLTNTFEDVSFPSSTLSWIAPVSVTTPSRIVRILPGIYYNPDNSFLIFEGSLIDFGPGQPYETASIPSGWWNKIGLTIGDDNVVKMYESTSQSTSGAVSYPSLPPNEAPIAIITVHDDSGAGPGTIDPIVMTDIFDVRNFLNTGSIENTAFNPIYKDSNNFIVQKGSSWYNNSYITLTTNLTVSGNVSIDDIYYIYLDYNNATGGVNSSSFITMLDDLENVEAKRYIPLGKYDVIGGLIQKNTFTAYDSKIWHYRSLREEDVFVTPLLGQTIFNTSFNFVNYDYLEIKIGGFKVFEFNDYIKTPPNTVTFNYLVKSNSEVRIRKI